MFTLLSLLAYSDLGLLLAVIGVYVFFAALWLVYVTTERTAKGTVETEKRIERLRHETVQEIANARAMKLHSRNNHSKDNSHAIEEIRSELATVRDIVMVNCDKLAQAEANRLALSQQIETQASLIDSHVEEYHQKDADYKLFDPSHVVVVEKPADDLSDQDPELGLVYYKRPSEPDDLTRIWGIGATNRDLLNEHGVFFFHQVAAWTDVNIAKFNDILCFRGRIEREDWVGQASRLANDASQSKAA